METPDNFSGQLTEAIMRAFSQIHSGAIVPLETTEYNKVYNHVYNILHSTSLDEKMREGYEAVQSYQVQMRKRHEKGIDMLQEAFPDGMFTTDKHGDRVGINVMVKGIFCNILDIETAELLREVEKLKLQRQLGEKRTKLSELKLVHATHALEDFAEGANVEIRILESEIGGIEKALIG
jgi:hypothetical protein